MHGGLVGLEVQRNDDGDRAGSKSLLGERRLGKRDQLVGGATALAADAER